MLDMIVRDEKKDDSFSRIRIIMSGVPACAYRRTHPLAYRERNFEAIGKMNIRFRTCSLSK